MKFPIHAWRRSSVVPTPAIAHPAPLASPPLNPIRDSEVPHDTALPITTAKRTQSTRLEMVAMLKEDWISVKHFARTADWKVVLRACVRRYLWKWYLIAAIAIVLTVLITTQHDAVVHFCAPVVHTIRAWPGGWLIPLVLLIIVSYPPLVGHEIIGLLVGLVWGMGEGFAILAAGTFLGEILLWFSFKWCCTNAASKFEKKNRLYWSLTQLIREKTFMFVLILRFSAIPGHIVTAVSASAGANYWSYLAAAFLTLPKQFVIVYLGEAFGHKEKKHQIISTVTLLTTVVVTGIAAVYVYYQMRLVWKRRELELPTTLGVQMVENPTWADVVEAEKREVEEKDMVMINGEKSFLPTLGMGEKPWTTATGTGSRAWSVPHHMTEAEMREFREEMDGSSQPIPSVKIDEVPRFAASFDIPRSSTSTPSPTRPSNRHLDIAPDEPNTPDSARAGSPSSLLPHSTDRSGSRYTSSLDLARSENAAGGRSVADDADNYAYNRGGRRPDFGRMRGESRAALLGQPKKL